MHTCKGCMFCHYRDLRIAAFGAVDRVAPVQPHDVGPERPYASAPPSVEVEASLPQLVEEEA